MKRARATESSFKTLRRNHFLYEYFLRRRVLEAADSGPEALMERIGLLANFAWNNHTGYYYDGRMENLLLDYGSNLERYADPSAVRSVADPWQKRDEYDTLHVATELCEVGGHTRVLYQFLKRNNERNAAVLLTKQTGEKIPRWFVEDLPDVPILPLGSAGSLFDRALILRRIAGRARKVILYHHPDDVVPIMAFADHRCPPVLLENHAHSWFWLGSSVADLVFTHSDFHKDLTIRTRPVKLVYNLTFTQLGDVDFSFAWESKEGAKRALGLAADETCIITIGTQSKFIPNRDYDFFKTAKKILQRWGKASIFIIGVPESLTLIRKYGLDPTRFHLLGPVEDPTRYYQAADICLDALPQPSLGGTAYAAIVGLACPLFKYGFSSIFNAVNFGKAPLCARYVCGLRDEKEYLDRLQFLMDNPEIRRGIAHEIRESYIGSCSDEALDQGVRELLARTESLQHGPGRIPDGLRHFDADSAEIASTSYFQNPSDLIRSFGKYLSMRDKLSIMLSLWPSRAYAGEVLRFAGALAQSKARHVLSSISRPMVARSYGGPPGTGLAVGGEARTDCAAQPSPPVP